MNEKQLIQILGKTVESGNLVDDEEAAKVLKISKKTLFNKVSKGLSAELYTISPITGKRFWFKDKIMGLS
ncbi:MAG: hypothetical protein ACTHMM_18420 [Agriterribacter sp.]